MKKLISILILIFIFIGCSQNPKSKFLNEKTIQQDTIKFSKKERKLINDYINEKGFVGWDTNNFWYDSLCHNI